MFKVKEFEKGEVLISRAGYKAPHKGFGIVHPNGEVVIQPGKLPEFYKYKATATTQCELLNGNYSN